MSAGPSSASSPLEVVHSKETCPNSAAEMAKIIESQPITTLGTVPGIDSKKAGAMKEMWENLKQDPRFDFEVRSPDPNAEDSD